jgi:RNA ligase (TIGR02306 family)
MFEMTLDEILNTTPALAQVVEIKDAIKTPGSDRLTSYSLKGMGWTVISSNINQTEENFGEPRYKPSDKVIYIAIDSILPEKLERLLFPEGSKITLSGGRIKTLKLRGAYSQGMLINLSDFSKVVTDGDYDLKPGRDVTKALGITKFEPPVSSIPKHMRGQQSKKNPLFKEYTDVRHLKYYTESNIFEFGELVYVTAKLHGTSARYALLPTYCPNLPRLCFGNLKEYGSLIIKHVKKFFGFLPEYEYCFGSRRCQLQDKPKDHKTFYEDNVYRTVGEAYGFKKILQPGEELFGEIAGPGIQKGYDYNFKEHKFFAYDVMINGQFLDSENFKNWCDAREVPRVSELGVIPYDLDELTKLASAKTCLNGQKTREGVVVKKVVEQNHPSCGRVCFKLINPEYLLKDQSDFH